jgi:hypothetical protein
VNSKNKRAMTKAERAYVETLKGMCWCACCGEWTEEPEVHEIKQGDWFTAVPLDADCHRGAFNGLHGLKRAWTVRKMDEYDALSRTIRRLMTEMVT